MTDQPMEALKKIAAMTPNDHSKARGDDWQSGYNEAFGLFRMIAGRALTPSPPAQEDDLALADALERAEWSNVSIGNKIMITSAIAKLRRGLPSPPQEGGIAEVEGLIAEGRAAAHILHRHCEMPRPAAVMDKLAAELSRLSDALERIALLDEADGHELTVRQAFEAVAIATKTLGKHPSEIFFARRARALLEGDKE